MSEKPPQHAFEITIRIGANTWEYARSAAQEIAYYIADREPDQVNLSSGGWDGCHSVDLQRRRISPEDYRKELEAWREKQ